MVFGEVQMVILTLVNGKKVKLTVMEFIYGLMEIVMKENGKLVFDMVMGQIFLQMVISTLDNTELVIRTVTVNINGLMEILILGSSKMV
jgi:hypothetical protein